MNQDDLFKIDSLIYPVFLGTNLWTRIHDFIQPYFKSGGIFILTDDHCYKYCLPLLRQHLPELANQKVYSLEPGEKSKDQAGLEKVWNWLMKSGAHSDSLLINLGGGVVSDLGGFAAATFKRGIDYINIPTSLIGQADAAIGGKTGIDLSGVKNQAGVFCDPAAVFIIPAFLKTLPENHFRSGFAEIIKCAVLSGHEFWSQVKNVNMSENDHLTTLIYKTVNFKCKIVSEDPYDESVRKMLNFGHTIGHALEGFFNRSEMPVMLHGEAVAAGMICEAYLSTEIAGLAGDELSEISTVIQ
ncbi:MAG: 3-dehydroquinate synthase, partial [Bacteroidales bacterium]|nr:3-dehydroquinate synthase [Bacteroidales bacterium]